MIAFPSAKINLGLYVEGKRPDGFHDIQSIIAPVDMCDSLEIVSTTATRPLLNTYGLPVPGNEKDNLCIKAWQLLNADFSIDPVEFNLVKKIPAGAGLGGGSSDGAQALVLLNRFFGLGLSQNQLLGYAARLGSDCPFFVQPRVSYVTGKGDVLSPYNGDNLRGLKVCILTAQIHIDTKKAYQNITSQPLGADLSQRLANSPVKQWKNWLRNGFQRYVFSNYPEIEKAVNWLYSSGALYACITGSGAGVFGFFDYDDVENREYDSMNTWWGNLR